MEIRLEQQKIFTFGSKSKARAVILPEGEKIGIRPGMVATGTLSINELVPQEPAGKLAECKAKTEGEETQ